MGDKMNMEKILVIGGGGYVGSILVQKLIDCGYQIKVFDNMYFGNIGLRSVLDKLELIVGDVRNFDTSILKDVQIVIQLAGLSNESTSAINPKTTFEINTHASARIAKLCKACDVDKYIFASTCALYYNHLHNDTGPPVSFEEQAPVFPTSDYTFSKIEAEKKLLDLASSKFSPVILRKGTIFGFSPRMRYDLVVNAFIKSSFTDKVITINNGGIMWRPMLNMNDLFQAYLACIHAPAKLISGEIFNVASENLQIFELGEQMKRVLSESLIEVQLDLRPYTEILSSYCVSTQKIQKVLDFKPNLNLKATVKNMIRKISEFNYTDFNNPIYYNYEWMKMQNFQI